MYIVPVNEKLFLANSVLIISRCIVFFSLFLAWELPSKLFRKSYVSGEGIIVRFLENSISFTSDSSFERNISCSAGSLF